MKANYFIIKTIIIAVAIFATVDNVTAQSNQTLDFVSVNSVTAQLNTAIIENVATQSYQEFGVMRDLSESQQAEKNRFETVEITSKTIDALDLINNGHGYGFYSAVIGQDAFPVVESTYVKETNYWLTSKKKRKVAIDEARSKIIKNLESLLTAEPTYKYSSLYRGMAHFIKQMDKECVKTIYVITDGSESHVYNFYEVKDWNAEYETIKKTLLADMKLPLSVKNLEIVFISSGRDEITVQSLRFWEKFFAEHGIKTSVRASL